MSINLLFGAAAFVGLLGFFLSRQSESVTPNVNDNPSGARPLFGIDAGRFGDPTINELYQRHAARTGLQWELLKAIAIVESSENPDATNSDGSTGIMQVLCIPDGKGGCSNDFPAIPEWDAVKGNRNNLFNSDINIMIGSDILKWNMDTYGFEKGIAIYNNWGARNDPEAGPFRNQSYVNKVIFELENLTGSFSAF